ncbi:hypothetical protein SIN8267_02824 [Sinobacterium norvegicum]|uniref:Non-specific serine/threonine protein kinase n=1 Tax=Sinobacterium norvegicum TaxID=1641715 RepID=A0ABN8EJR7_9GAMM|nr:lipopolysaccharide kinase InaA family protein [Sinobacterium norvegicum]CAH0992691.1 hypothetical protein SIN8267_02824 [Sinobacterium norvegicum]
MPATTSLPCYTACDLTEAGRQLTAPFTLDIAPALNAWQCQQILRLLPQKRLVLKLQNGDEQAILKLFFRAKDYQREIDGWQLLQQAELPTADIIAHHAQDDLQYILFQCIDGQSLAHHWQQQGGKQQQIDLLLRALPTLAQMHRAGLIQADIHLDNFLLHQNQLILIDYASIKQGDKPLKPALAQHNLAFLLAQLPSYYARFYPQIVNQYILNASDQDYAKAINIPDLTAQVSSLREKRWLHFEKKIARDCSEFIALQSFSERTVIRRDCHSPAMMALLDNPDLAIADGHYLKQGNSATVSLISIDNQAYVIKRYNIKGFVHGIKRALRVTRAWSSWRSGYKLIFEGLTTPLPVAIKEQRIGVIRRQAYLICRAVDGKDLWQVYNDGEACPVDKTVLDQQVIALFEAMLSSRVSHGDFKGTNLIVTAEGLNVIDLDAMTLHNDDKSLKKALKKDLARFIRNFEPVQQQHFELLLSDFSGKLDESSIAG